MALPLTDHLVNNKKMSPRSKQANEKIRQKTRQKIVTSAIMLFSASGFNGTSISQIAETAGVSKGLIYTYFDNKEAIIKGIIDTYLEDMKDFEEGFALMLSKSTPAESIAFVLDQTLKLLVEQKQKWKILTLFSLKMNDFPYIHQLSVNKYTGYRKLFEALFHQMNYANPVLEAQLLIAQIDGLSMEYLMLDNDHFDIALIFNEIKNKYTQYEKNNNQ